MAPRWGLTPRWTPTGEPRRSGPEVERILTEAGATDAAEDVGLGRARGDELLAELASPISRLARLKRA